MKFLLVLAPSVEWIHARFVGTITDVKTTRTKVLTIVAVQPEAAWDTAVKLLAVSNIHDTHAEAFKRLWEVSKI